MTDQERIERGLARIAELVGRRRSLQFGLTEPPSRWWHEAQEPEQPDNNETETP